MATMFEFAHRKYNLYGEQRECSSRNGILKMTNMETEKCDISFYSSICDWDLEMGTKKIGGIETDEMKPLILPRDL
jgi:hypothetical protein